ncbi:MAG: hypothetical protein AAFP20_09720 [Cyanobacteria bacterium J06614_10]
MPQPCRQPLTPNPFESYRDPVTGEWKVKYPASNLPLVPQSPALTQSLNPSLEQPEEDSIRLASRRRWKQPTQTTSQTRVA